MSANFAIVARDAAGQLHNLPPNSSEYTFVASAINIALKILETSAAHQRLTQLALDFDSSARGSNHFGGHAHTAQHAVDNFLTKIKANFPCVIVDHKMTHLDNLGSHPRGTWNGTLADFNPRVHTMVCINGSRVNSMVAAWEGSSKDKVMLQRFWNFQFLFATTLVHEVGGHLFVTYLSNGRPITPPEISAQGYGGHTNGESGRWLEMHLFGGNTEYYHDASQDNGQTGVPHQIDAEGRAWKIDPKVINQVCKYGFSFPFARTGHAINPSTMHRMGRASSDPPANPQDRNMLAQQFPLMSMVRGLKGYNVKVKDVVKIPTHPDHRLVAV